MKLYNHAHAPNPRRVRIFAAEKGIELALEEIDILAGQSRTSEFLAKNSSGAVPVLELDDGTHLSSSRHGANQCHDSADNSGAALSVPTVPRGKETVPSRANGVRHPLGHHDFLDSIGRFGNSFAGREPTS